MNKFMRLHFIFKQKIRNNTLNDYVPQKELVNRNFYLKEFKRAILKELKNCKYPFNSKVKLKKYNSDKYCYFIKHNNLLD